ncbi:MAG: hypothetical protein WAV41_05360 [Microgenomates group bacterium]
MLNSESIDNINYQLEQNDPIFFGKPLGLDEDLAEIQSQEVMTADDSAMHLSMQRSRDGVISYDNSNEWFDYYYHGEQDLYQDEEDIEFVDNDLLDTVGEILDKEFVRMPEIRPLTADDVAEVPEWLFELAGGEDNYWCHEKSEEMWYRESIVQEIVMAEMRDINKRRLPDCRLMTVLSKNARRWYEYISVRTGRIRYSDRGNWYYEETRYPIKESGEIQPRKRRAVAPDVCAIEELTPLGIPKEECTTDLLIDICRRQSSKW